jgi:hypothetical protein
MVLNDEFSRIPKLVPRLIPEGGVRENDWADYQSEPVAGGILPAPSSLLYTLSGPSCPRRDSTRLSWEGSP